MYMTATPDRIAVRKPGQRVSKILRLALRLEVALQ